MTQSSSKTGVERNVKLHLDDSIKVADAARLLGKTPNTIRNWIERGAPVAHAGDKGSGNVTRVILADIVDWNMREQIRAGEGEDGDGETSEQKKKRAEAEDWHYRAKIRKAQAYREIGALIPVDVIADVVAKEYGRVRSSLFALPGRLSTRLSALEDPAEIARTMQDEINASLASLSDPEEVAQDAGADTARSIEEPIDIEDPVVTPDESDEDGLDTES